MALCDLWPSYTVGLYKNETLTPLSEPMGLLEVSLLGGLPALGAMLGTAMVGWLMHWFGKKRTGVILSLHYIASWVMITTTGSPAVVLAARLVAGVAQGGFCVFGPAFVSEIAESSIRGTLAAGPIALFHLGALLSYLLGWFQSYTNILHILLAISVFGLVLQLLVVESPIYLLQCGREAEARTSIALYRGTRETSEAVLEELSRLKRQLSLNVELVLLENPDEERQSIEVLQLKKTKEEIIWESKPKTPAWKLLFTNPVSRRAIFIVLSTISLEVFMGMMAIQVYARTLFELAAPGVSSNLCSVLLAVVLFCGSATTVVLADRAGRRILLISSSALVSLCMLGLGVLLQTGVGPTWLKAALLLMYCYTFDYGAGSIPFVLLAEMFLPEVHRYALLVAVEWMWFLSFLVIALFNALVIVINLYGLFYCFACVAVINVVFCYYVVPETKGLSAEQIQEVLRRECSK
ncbi:Facilitated trehalose transporter Tret1 [Eumeta japonica]|uniref:Facilitated trehalose transporter Tret1 n=1 Tax=Eumeta variegata TaxID=151549 RepID=A0A4C1SJ51_EUMVA|nr:Facilitated trehalose transporter Tret1 [Eumeta japonica]